MGSVCVMGRNIVLYRFDPAGRYLLKIGAGMIYNGRAIQNRAEQRAAGTIVRMNKCLIRPPMNMPLEITSLIHCLINNKS